jgi:hypothetical protein
VRRKAARVLENAVFLNLPYDEKFRSLYLAYIAGLVHLGFIPRVTLGLPGGARRLDKIFDEIKACRYSIHDLSRVSLDRNPPYATPRFNMPFELGLAVAWEKMHPEQHKWFVFESKDYRLLKSLSDLNGTDPQIHKDTVSGVLRELSNVFRRPANQPTVPEMTKTFDAISRRLPTILSKAGATSAFEARAFQDLCYEARIAAEKWPA